jgi:hypothetical protein
MDFLVICQALGLAIAAGLLIGAVVPPVMPDWGVIAGAAPLGIVAAGLALNGEDEALWPALPLGLLGSALAGLVARDIVAGATRRVATRDVGSGSGRGQAAGGVPAIVALTALVLALVSLFVPPVSLVALLALVWLWLSRRRRAEQKHEGLRVLR